MQRDSVVVRPRSRTPREPRYEATEAQSQSALIEWRDRLKGMYPDIGMLFHVPNGGKRDKAEAARLKKQGVTAGVADLFLMVAAGGYHGLWIEMKTSVGRVEAEQHRFLNQAIKGGYAAVLCRSWTAAAAEVLKYLGLPAELAP
jgi:hypothetical protein